MTNASSHENVENATHLEKSGMQWSLFDTRMSIQNTVYLITKMKNDSKRIYKKTSETRPGFRTGTCFETQMRQCKAGLELYE